MASAAVVIVNYGSSDLLEWNLSGLPVSPARHVVIVDCFTTGDEALRVEGLCEQRGWHSVLLDRNVGFGAGVNAGAARAMELGIDVLLTLNPDAVIDADALDALVGAAVADPLALISPRIVTGEGRTWFDGADLYLDDGTHAGAHRRAELGDRPRREWATGACFAISIEMWCRVGGFDDDYFLYWEDVDLSHRVLDAGGRLSLVEAQVIHDEGQTHTRRRHLRGKSEIYYYYNIRNRMLYATKHLNTHERREWARSAPRVAYEVLLQGGRRQLLVSIAPWRAYVRGLRDGLRLERETDKSVARKA